MQASGPMIVQSDLSILLDVHAPRFEEGRESLGSFALLEKSPEHLHTYRITPLSLWNAAAAGLSPDEVLGMLTEYSRYDVPKDIPFIVRDTMARFGALVLKDEAAAADGSAPGPGARQASELPSAELPSAAAQPIVSPPPPSPMSRPGPRKADPFGQGAFKVAVAPKRGLFR